MSGIQTWEETKSWYKRHRTFSVEIKRWINGHGSHYRGAHMWNVYANIFDTHPLFNIFNNQTQKDLDAIDELKKQFHWGITFKREVTSLSGLHKPQKIKTVQLGSDYNHLHDDYFSHLATLEAAHEVKEDAEALFNYLLEKSEV